MRRFLQPIEPTFGGLLGYRDPDHLNEPGAFRLATLVRREVFASKWNHEVTTDYCAADYPQTAEGRWR